MAAVNFCCVFFVCATIETIASVKVVLWEDRSAAIDLARDQLLTSDPATCPSIPTSSNLYPPQSHHLPIFFQKAN